MAQALAQQQQQAAFSEEQQVRGILLDNYDAFSNPCLDETALVNCQACVHHQADVAVSCMQAAATCTVDTACLTWIKYKLQLVSVQCEGHDIICRQCQSAAVDVLVHRNTVLCCTPEYDPYTPATVNAHFLGCELQLLHGEVSSDGQAWLEQAWQPAAHQQPIAAFLTSLKVSACRQRPQLPAHSQAAPA
jgi:hypothetical protein